MNNILLLLLITSMAHCADDAFNGHWSFDDEQTKKFGIGESAWGLQGNLALITSLKTMQLLITNNTITSKIEDKVIPIGLGDIVIRTNKQLVVYNPENKKACLLTLSSENSMVVEFGHIFRYFLKRNPESPNQALHQSP